ncbi:MAG TPA: hypothetical protein VNL71_20935 [Chloroflexota bacterium]|nr:hypothetical protein [Chloroflexota bacterium]
MRACLLLPNRTHATPFFAKEVFHYDPAAYTCPNGATLPYSRINRAHQQLLYQAPAATCIRCPLKPRRAATDQGRVVSRHYDEEFRDRVRICQATDA